MSRSSLRTKYAVSEVPRLDPEWDSMYDCEIVDHGLLDEVSFGYSFDDFD